MISRSRDQAGIPGGPRISIPYSAARRVIASTSGGSVAGGGITDGLPGIGTNTLTARLKHLEAAGVVRRRLLPLPDRATVYELTEYGHELEPILLALGRWGTRSMGLAARRGGDPLALARRRDARLPRPDPAGSRLRRPGSYASATVWFTVRGGGGESLGGRGGARAGGRSRHDVGTEAACVADAAVGAGTTRLLPARSLVEGDQTALARLVALFDFPSRVRLRNLVRLRRIRFPVDEADSAQRNQLREFSVCNNFETFSPHVPKRR